MPPDTPDDVVLPLEALDAWRDSNPEFLDVDDVLAIHKDALARHGGAEGIRDRGALESAVAQPQATFQGEYLYGDIFAMAAAYAFHIAEAQAFLEREQAHGATCGRYLSGYERDSYPRARGHPVSGATRDRRSQDDEGRAW
jgi:hypothetical protein